METHPASFIETGSSCSGPRYVRSQPSREHEGTILTDIEDKYITEYSMNAPFTNLYSFARSLEISWPKLNDTEKVSILGILNTFIVKNKLLSNKHIQQNLKSNSENFSTLNDEDIDKYFKENPEKLKALISKNDNELKFIVGLAIIMMIFIMFYFLYK